MRALRQHLDRISRRDHEAVERQRRRRRSHPWAPSSPRPSNDPIELARTYCSRTFRPFRVKDPWRYVQDAHYLIDSPWRPVRVEREFFHLRLLPQGHDPRFAMWLGMNAPIRRWVESYNHEVFRAGQIKFCLTAALFKALQENWRIAGFDDDFPEDLFWAMGEWCDVAAYCIMEAVCQSVPVERLPADAEPPPGQAPDDDGPGPEFGNWARPSSRGL